MNVRIWAPAFVTILGTAAFAQEIPGAVTGAPYSADDVTERVRTLADGTHLTHTTTGKIYRDSEGRTRTEINMDVAADAGDPTVRIEIFDPVARVRYTFNTQQKVVHKFILSPGQGLPMQQAGETGGQASSSAPARMAQSEVQEANRPTHTKKNLGTQIIEGLVVQGRRHTTTWPAGSHMGNDRPVTQISEAWRSPELRIDVLSKLSGPQIPDITRKLTKISRTEPDPSLFQPPADYVVKSDDRGEN
ncbi:MAG: hypothetical protein ABSH50_19055 [Bryobacteraceae bacterium]|jgi:hypothetical protein